MRSASDLVLVDCASPAIAPVVTPIIRDSDGVIVVVRRDRETRAAVQKLREQICPARRHETCSRLPSHGGTPQARDNPGRLVARAVTACAASLLVGVTVVGGAVMALFASPLGKLMTGGEVEPLLLLGWVAYLGVWRRACHT